jgi:hypothetical protein
MKRKNLLQSLKQQVLEVKKELNLYERQRKQPRN